MRTVPQREGESPEGAEQLDVTPTPPVLWSHFPMPLKHTESRDALQARLLQEVKGGGCEVPAQAESQACPGDVPTTAAGGDALQSSQWVAVPDPEGSGDSYYWNRNTGETTWDEPPGFVADTDVAPAAAASEVAVTNHVEPSSNTSSSDAGGHADYEQGQDSISRDSEANSTCDGDEAPEEIQRALWYYKDASGQQQGPFPLCNMQTWYGQGFFPVATLVRRLCDDDWAPVGDCSEVTTRAAAAASASSEVASAAGSLHSAQAVGGDSDYATRAFFNRHTGKFDEDVAVSMERQQDMYNYRAKRQLNAFFGTAPLLPPLLMLLYARPMQARACTSCALHRFQRRLLSRVVIFLDASKFITACRGPCVGPRARCLSDYDSWQDDRQKGVKKAKPDKSRKKKKSGIPDWYYKD